MCWKAGLNNPKNTGYAQSTGNKDPGAHTHTNTHSVKEDDIEATTVITSFQTMRTLSESVTRFLQPFQN